MAGWLEWTLVALAAWCAVSLVVALLLGQLFRREARRRPVVLVGSAPIRVRGRGLKKVS